MRKEYDFIRGRRGPLIKRPTRKTRITIRLDKEVLAWFKGQVHKAGGGNYQSLINRALRDHVRHYVASAGKRKLRRLLKEEALRYAERDRKIAEEWSALD